MKVSSPIDSVVGACLLWRWVLALIASGHLLNAASVDELPLKPINHERFEALDAIDFSVVACFEQDSFGFMWIGTKDGLICFDGYETKHYMVQVQEVRSLTDNSIMFILESHVPGDLWVLTENGILHYLDRKNERFKLLQPKPDPNLEWQAGQEVYLDKIAQGPDGNLWASSAEGMIYELDFASKTFRRLGSSEFSGDRSLLDEPKLVTVLVWEPNRPERLVILTHEKGMIVLDLPQHSAAHRIVQLEDLAGTSQRIYGGLGNGAGQVWVMLDNRAVIRWDPDSDQWKTIPVLDDSSSDDQGALDGDLIFCELADDGVLWMGYQNLNNAVTRFDPASEEFDHFYLAGSNPQDFSRPACGFFDRQGMFWVGGNRGDVYLVRPPQPGVLDWRDALETPLPRSLGVSALLEDDSGGLWMGTAMHGLYRIDRLSHEVLHWTADDGIPGGLKIDDIASLYQDDDGSIWIGTNGAGLHRLDPDTEQWRWYDPDTSSPTLKSGRRIRAMLRDSFQQFWIATKDGLKRLDAETGGVEIFQRDPKDPKSISDNSVRNLYEDSAGVLWVATDNGLNRYNRESNQFTRYLPDPGDPNKISSGLVRCMLEDSLGRFWVGTRNGLNLMDRVRGTFKITNEYISNDSNVFLSLVEDHSGNIWAGAGKGLFKVGGIPLRFQLFT